MKIIQMMGNKVHWITPYESWDEVPEFAPDIVLQEAPDDVQEGFIYDAKTNTYSESEDTDDKPNASKVILEITNAEIVQQINDLRADLIIAGVI